MDEDDKITSLMPYSGHNGFNCEDKEGSRSTIGSTGGQSAERVRIFGKFGYQQYEHKTAEFVPHNFSALPLYCNSRANATVVFHGLARQIHRWQQINPSETYRQVPLQCFNTAARPDSHPCSRAGFHRPCSLRRRSHLHL